MPAGLDVGPGVQERACQLYILIYPRGRVERVSKVGEVALGQVRVGSVVEKQSDHLLVTSFRRAGERADAVRVAEVRR